MPNKGFFGSLFDLSFTSMVTTKIIKMLYVLTLIALGFFGLIFTIAAFKVDAAAGALTLLILAPLGFVFYAVYARVLLEFVMAVFRIMETNAELVALQRNASTPAAPASAPTA